jgi:hypothetical protein
MKSPGIKHVDSTSPEMPQIVGDPSFCLTMGQCLQVITRLAEAPRTAICLFHQTIYIICRLQIVAPVQLTV